MYSENLYSGHTAGNNTNFFNHLWYNHGIHDIHAGYRPRPDGYPTLIFIPAPQPHAAHMTWGETTPRGNPGSTHWFKVTTVDPATGLPSSHTSFR